MPLPPEVDDAISPHSPLRPPRKSFAFALRTAAVPPGRHIGTRECCNVKPLRLHDTALAALDGVCYNPDAAHRYRFATHSFNGWRCCPIPTFAKTSLGNSFASSLHSHVASMLRRLIGLTFIAHRMMARNWRCLVDDKRFPVSAPWVRRGTRSISPMPAAAALLQSFVRAVLTWRNRSVTSNCKQPDDTSSAVLPLIA